MNYKVLYRKYRPDNFFNIVGQEYIVQMLKKTIESGKNAHAYIFTGPRGTGKTSSAKIFAKALNCLHPIAGSPCGECESCLNFNNSSDIIEIDAASNNGVDEIRELINNVKLVPTSFKYKVYIIDEVHMLTASAFNALLLTLEEPPSHIVFILATTDIQNVPITILSRCQRFDFKPINKQALEERLRFVADNESISITDDAIQEIALLSAGGLRDALGMLDQLSSNDEEITVELVSSYFGSISTQKISKLLTAIENNSTEELLEILENIKSSGTNYSVFIEKLINEIRKNAIQLKSGKAKYNFSFSMMYSLVFDLNECLCNININVNPYILIEMVLLKYINYNEHLLNVGNIEKEDSKNNADLGNKKILNNNLGNKKISNENNKNLSVISFNVDTRINNCFCNVAKEYKNKILKSWIDFMNYLIDKNKALVSLLADTSVCAASDQYAIISSKIDSTNDLINVQIKLVEDFYSEFIGQHYNFVALSSKNWNEAMNKYKLNIKNGNTYTFIEEKLEKNDILSTEGSTNEEETIEDIAKDIFGTFEVE